MKSEHIKILALFCGVGKSVGLDL